MSNSSITIEKFNVTLTALVTVLNQAKLRPLELVIVLFIGTTIIMLLVNIFLTKKHTSQLAKYIQDEKFSRQILQPPIRPESNESVAYVRTNEPMRFPEPRHVNFDTDQIDVYRREQEQFETFPIYYIDEQQNNRTESPLKPLADMMNQRSQAYQNEFSTKRVKSTRNEQKRNSFQKKTVSSVRNEFNGDEEEHSYEIQSSEIVNESNSTKGNRNGQYFVKKEKSFDNLTVISEIRRSKSSDFGSSNRKN